MPGEVRDDLLRILFVSCDEAIPLESQPVFALKTLCGFSVREIALRLFTSDANVYKRLIRARDRLREHPPRIEELTSEQHASRLPSVQEILYVLFTEGYLSSHADDALRLAAILHKVPDGLPSPGGASSRADSRNICAVSFDASARGTDDCTPGRIRRVAPFGGAGPGAVGSAENSDRVGVAGEIRTRRRLFALPPGGRDRVLPPRYRARCHPGPARRRNGARPEIHTTSSCSPCRASVPASGRGVPPTTRRGSCEGRVP